MITSQTIISYTPIPDNEEMDNGTISLRLLDLKRRPLLHGLHTASSCYCSWQVFCNCIIVCIFLYLYFVFRFVIVFAIFLHEYPNPSWPVHCSLRREESLMASLPLLANWKDFWPRSRKNEQTKKCFHQVKRCGQTTSSLSNIERSLRTKWTNGSHFLMVERTQVDSQWRSTIQNTGDVSKSN